MEQEKHQMMKDESLAGSPCWEAVDAVVCINLDRRTDRWESFCKTVRGVIPAQKIHRLSGVEGTRLPGYGEAPWFTERTGARSHYWGGATGCTLAHTKAIRLAMEKGWRNVMIFEDDIEAKMTREGLEMVCDALRNLSGRYLIYLGYSRRAPHGVCLKQGDHSSLWRIDGAHTTHAYIVPESMYRPLLEALPASRQDAWEWMSWHRAIDCFYRNEVALWRGVRIYVVLPLMFHQNGMRSDLVTTKITPPAHEKFVELGRFTRLLHRMVVLPCRRIKVWLNALRIHYRAVWGGFPGPGSGSALRRLFKRFR